ncbi:MAG: zf-HC2 domain-containing protein [Roseburia faecis]
MKITCDIVRDLMPLYVDDVCSDDSRKLIEDHINHCSKCQNELAAMKDPIECPPLSEVGDSKTPFFKIRKKVRIKMIAAIISTAFLVMTAMFAIQEVGVLHDFLCPWI